MIGNPNQIFFIFPIDYLRIFLFLLFIGFLLFIMLCLTFLLSYKSSYKDVDKLASYECGFEPFEDTRATFDVQFYLIAIIFIVFDVEIAFLYPWVISLRQFSDFNIFLPGFLFFIFVILGFIFEWFQGAFDWKMSNLSKIQLFSFSPFCFFNINTNFYSEFFTINLNNLIYIIFGVLLVCIFSFGFLVTIESSLIMYVIFIFNLFFEKYYTLFFIFTILLIILINFWLTLDNFEYNLDSKIILVFNLYALCAIFLVTSTNLFEMFLAMEGVSLSLIILIAYKTQRFTALEAAIKYFVQSSIIGCFFSFSVSILYLATGSFFLFEIFETITEQGYVIEQSYYAVVQRQIKNFVFREWDEEGLYAVGILFENQGFAAMQTFYNPLLIYAIATLSFCIFFKLSLFPMHFWTPDVYTGSPLVVTTIFATINKLIFFFVFFTITKFLIFPFFTSVTWKFFFSPLFQLSALLSICIGAFGAYRQTTIKRFFGYTTINTLGFILFPIAVDGFNGFFISLSYLIIYIFASLIFFSLLAKIYSYKNNLFYRVNYISDLSGLYRINKLVSFCLVFIILIFSGLPPYLTFYNKYFILQFLSNLTVNIYFIFAILVSTIITTYYYIRFIKSIFFEQPYLQVLLVELEVKSLYLTQQLQPYIKKMILTTNGRIESLVILIFIVFGMDIFELITFIL